MCAALTALIFAPSAISSAETFDGYPQSFVVSYTPQNFTDYAIGETAAAFAEGSKIILFDGGDQSFFGVECKREQKTFPSAVTALDLSDDGEFIYTLAGDEKVYNLSDGSESGAQINNFPLNENYGGYTYSIDEGTLKVWDHKTDPKETAGDFSKFKFYGGEAYAADGGRLKKVTAGNVEDVASIKYIDFSPAGEIKKGDASQKLGEISSELAYATVKAGYYATPVDLANSGEVFTAEPNATFKTDDRELNGKSALVLYRRENLAVISVGDKAYLLSPAALDPLVEGITEEDIGRSADVADDCSPYALPFINEATRMQESLKGGDEIWVVKKVYADELLHEFYLIAYADNHDEIIGYVAAGHVTEFHFDEEPPVSIPDPAPSTSDNVRTVVLILVVVVLVIAAVCYLTWVATSSKRKKAPSDDEDKEE